jgi:hypothetical protein
MQPTASDPQIANDVAVDVGKTEVPSLELIGQFCVIDAQAPQDGGMSRP